MINENEIEHLRDYWRSKLQKFGETPSAVGWSKGRQDIRFEILTKVGDLNRRSILDFGCGFGDLLEFLSKRGIEVEYTGIDLVPEFLDIARKRHPKASFIKREVLSDGFDRNYDYIIASGTFNNAIYMDGKHVKEIIKKLYSACDIGLACDMISNYVDWKDPGDFYAQPEEMFAFCKSLSKRVTLRHDYMPFEFCLYIYKDDSISKRNVFNALESDESFKK